MQEILGHADAETTMDIYAGLNEKVNSTVKLNSIVETKF